MEHDINCPKCDVGLCHGDNKAVTDSGKAPGVGDVMNYKGQTGIVVEVRQLDYVVSDGDYRWNVDKYATKSYWPSKLAYVCPRSIRDYLAIS